MPLSTPPHSSSQPTQTNGENEYFEPHSPSPEEPEIRGRTRTRQRPGSATQTQLNANAANLSDSNTNLNKSEKKDQKENLDGYHTFECMGRKFTIENRWKLVREMGIGAFGAVVSCQDIISEEFVAVKQINRVYDKPQLARRALREITLLRHFQAHPNITGLIDLDALSKWSNEIYIFMEPMEADLHQIIRSGQDLSGDHIAYFIYQILSAMKHIHACKVLHRDLKPGNILVNATCEIRICDLGLARGYDKSLVGGGEKVSPLTEYVATRWYRAPEIMLGFDGYDESIDIWSIGCIFGELLNGKPIFQGKDYVDQLKCIFEYLGSPPDEIVQRIAKGRARKYIRSLPIYRKKPFNFAKGGDQALDLLSSLLLYEPSSRLTAAQALEHPYLSSFYDPEDEYFLPQPTVFDRWREIESLETVEEFRDAIWKEIQDYRTQARALASESPSLSPVVSIRQPMPLREAIPEESESDPEDQANNHHQPFDFNVHDEENGPMYISPSHRHQATRSTSRPTRSESRAGTLSPVRTGSGIGRSVERPGGQVGKSVERCRPGRSVENSKNDRRDVSLGTVNELLMKGVGSPVKAVNGTHIEKGEARYEQSLSVSHTGDQNTRPAAFSSSPSRQQSTNAVHDEDLPPARPRLRMASEADRPRSYYTPTDALPRTRKISQADPYATFSRRSSAIFAHASPTASSVGLHSVAPSFAHFPVQDEDDIPSVAVPVRSRLPSMVDGSAGFKHLRTLSTIGIQECAERPGGLAALGIVGRLVGAQKTEGADEPPSDPPDELKSH